MAGNSRSWKPGESGNPGGRPAVVAEVRDLARKQTLPAIRKLTWLMHHGKPDAVKVQSCVALLDRGWGRPIQAINWRVLVSGPRPRVHLGEAPADPAASAAQALRGHRRAYFPEREGFVDAAVYDRYRLRPGARLSGPAIVEEREATTVVAPNDALLVDGHHNLILTVERP